MCPVCKSTNAALDLASPVKRTICPDCGLNVENKSPAAPAVGPASKLVHDNVLKLLGESKVPGFILVVNPDNTTTFSWNGCGLGTMLDALKCAQDLLKKEFLK